MKKLYYLVLLFIVETTFAQTNTFPVSGNVGIGTLSPGYKLDINGDLRINKGNVLRFFRPDSTTNGLNIFSGATNNFINAQNGGLIVSGVTSMSFDATSGHNFRDYAGTTTFMAIKNTGNVGMGTSSPAEKLDVNGVALFGSGTERTGINGSGLGFNRNPSNGLIYTTSGFAYQFQHFPNTTNTSDRLSLQLYNPSGASVTNPITFRGDGNVGIGSTNPQSKLEITGASGTSGLRFTNLTSTTTAASPNGKVLSVNNTGDVVLLESGGSMQSSDINGYRTYYTQPLSANESTPSRYEIARIFSEVSAWATTAPVEIELDETLYGSGAVRKYFVFFGYPDTYRLVQAESHNTGTGGQNNFQLSVGEPVVISGNFKYLPIYVDLKYFGRVKALIKTARPITTSNTTGPAGSIYINTNPTRETIPDFTANNTVTLSAGAANTVLSGNVGIGTATPAVKLDVRGAVNFNTQFFNENKLNYYGTEGTATSGQNRMAVALYSIGKKLFPDENFTYGLNSIKVYDNNQTNTVTINRITAPAGAPNKSGFVLEIKHAGAGQTPGLGGFYFANSTRSNATFACVFKAKLPVGYSFSFNSNWWGTGGKLYWATDNVGTGKWEDYVYVVRCGDSGTFSSTNFFFINGSPAPSAESPLIWHLASATVYDCDDRMENISATDALVSNKLGIGTAAPGTPLHVKGNAGILNIEGTDHGYIQFYPQLASGGRKSYIGFSAANSTGLVIGNEFTNGSISLINNNITAMQVNSSGQIGIGSATVPAGYKLAVAGNVIAEKIKVKKQSSGWPDYVFSPTYRLQGLDEVESYIKTNSHLPEIPSAKEIEKDGQDLGEMNRLLLKKVEELTLYLIEQNKNIIQQNSEIKSLKLKVEQLEKK